MYKGATATTTTVIHNRSYLLFSWQSFSLPGAFVYSVGEFKLLQARCVSRICRVLIHCPFFFYVESGVCLIVLPVMTTAMPEPAPTSREFCLPPLSLVVSVNSKRKNSTPYSEEENSWKNFCSLRYARREAVSKGSAYEVDETHVEILADIRI